MAGRSTQQGYLLLADISGYTSYVAGTELEHAQAILSELLELLVEQLTRTMTLSKLEGDAVFVDAPESRFPRGETLLELIEATYAAFRDRLDGMRRQTTCECGACRAIPTLDLKFFLHHGSYFVQSVAGIRELVGSDVNLIHRLTKNRVTETTGWRAYALFTEQSLAHVGMQPEGLVVLHEQYEHLGEITVYVMALHERYAERVRARRVFLEPKDAHVSQTLEIAAPPEVVWDWLNDPGKRLRYTHNEYRPDFRPGGRTEVGARNHCVHGKEVAMIETVVDWRPFEYFTTEGVCQKPPMTLIVTSALTPTETGTRLQLRAKAKLPAMGVLAPLACRAVFQMFGLQAKYRDMARLIEQEGTEQNAAEAPAATPVVAH